MTGIIAAIVPEVAVLVNEPILAVPEAKLPEALDNCAVKTFPLVKVPVDVNPTFILAPAQNGEPVIAFVVMVWLPITVTIAVLFVLILKLPQALLILDKV